MGKDGDPGEGNQTASRDPKMQLAKVRKPDGTSKDFELHRGSDGDVLFTMVSAELSIEEKEYFSLCFYEKTGTRHWLYRDKKIIRQLKGLPWEFSFEVKFYPTTPSTLNDDHARYNLFLQLRNDIFSGRLPATLPTHALLGSLVAQAEFGDHSTSAEYEQYLRTARLAPSMTEQLMDKIKELHKEHKGETPAEAEINYLDACKQLSMYGVFIFNAKDSSNQPISIGICSTGVNIYKETIRLHRFAWQNIMKISYRKNQFAVKLKAGEVENKEVTLVYKVADYAQAKRIWKCGVEHHTFFRLIQPEDKPKSGLFRWGSARFRYQGRTQFQTKMASQMFDRPASATVQRTNSARLTQSCDNVAKDHQTEVGTLGYADNELGSKNQMTSPGISYEVSSNKRAGAAEGKGKKSKKSKKGVKEADFSNSSDSDDEKQMVATLPRVEHDTGRRTPPSQLVSADQAGTLVRHETKHLHYHLKGEGVSPGFDPQRPSLSSTIAEAERLNQRSPRLEHAERTVTVRALAPLPLSFEESGQPHMTVDSWQETNNMPDDVTIEYDEHGNKITRTIKTSQVKHTVQKQTFQNYVVPDENEPEVASIERIREQATPLGVSSEMGGPMMETHTRTMEYQNTPAYAQNDELGEFVSSKTVTTGNRTVETITYKTERDGIVETHVEHRVTIHSEATIDHDAELSQAILEATQMNPDMTVEKIEVRQETTA